MSYNPLRDPVIRVGFAVNLVLWALVALVFLGALAGDAVGLWEFDSGLGCEKGDGVCR